MEKFKSFGKFSLVSVFFIYVIAAAACDKHESPKETEHNINSSEEHSGHDHSKLEESEKDDHSDCSGHDHLKHEETAKEVHDVNDGEDHSGHDHSKHEEAEESEKADHSSCSGHDHGESNDAGIKLNAKQIKEAGIKIESVKLRKLHKEISLLGDITVNEDMTVHVVSRVPGNVKKVWKTIGDKVKKGEVLADLDSRELADAKANYLTALEKYTLEKTIFAQEENIYKKKISSEREYINAKQAMADARIALRSTKQKLVALGISNTKIEKLPELPDETLTHFEIRAPFDGTIISKHITQGEVIKEDKDGDVNFVIANLDTVWVNLRVSQKDLPIIHTGQHATISAGSGIPDTEGVIDFVSPVLGEDTRTALARVAINNTGGKYRPGLFVTAVILIECKKPEICVPVSAVQNIDDE